MVNFGIERRNLGERVLRSDDICRVAGGCADIQDSKRTFRRDRSQRLAGCFVSAQVPVDPDKIEEAPLAPLGCLLVEDFVFDYSAGTRKHDVTIEVPYGVCSRQYGLDRGDL